MRRFDVKSGRFMSQRLTNDDENPICHPDPELDSGVSGSQNEEMLKQVQHDKEQGFSGEKGVTLIELMIVLLILSIIAG